MQITQRRLDQKWILLNDKKEVIQEFNSRDEAVGYMKTLTAPKPQEPKCGHGNRGPRQPHVFVNPRFSEGSWEAGKPLYIKGSQMPIETMRWSEPYVDHWEYGSLCYDCGEIV